VKPGGGVARPGQSRGRTIARRVDCEQLARTGRKGSAHVRTSSGLLVRTGRKSRPFPTLRMSSCLCSQSQAARRVAVSRPCRHAVMCSAHGRNALPRVVRSKSDPWRPGQPVAVLGRHELAYAAEWDQSTLERTGRREHLTFRPTSSPFRQRERHTHTQWASGSAWRADSVRSRAQIARRTVLSAWPPGGKAALRSSPEATRAYCYSVLAVKPRPVSGPLARARSAGELGRSPKLLSFFWKQF
jgi:hypothetical protein